jgi:hypothetical protein
MSLRIDLVDPVICTPVGMEPIGISLEEQVVNNRKNDPCRCAKVAIGRPGSSYKDWWNISSEGLRALARAAICMAEDIEARQEAAEVPR